MDDSTPRQRAEADDSLASWIQENCPELPNIIRKHIQTMTKLDGQGQDVLVRLILLSVRIHIPEKCKELFEANDISSKMGTAIRELCRGNGSPSKTAIDRTVEILQEYKHKQEAVNE